MLKPGDSAPDFDLESDTGETFTLASFGGKRAVIFFYPKDNTSG